MRRELLLRLIEEDMVQVLLVRPTSHRPRPREEVLHLTEEEQLRLEVEVDTREVGSSRPVNHTSTSNSRCNHFMRLSTSQSTMG